MMSTGLQVDLSLLLNIPPTSGLLYFLYLCPGYSSLTSFPGDSYSPFELQLKYHVPGEAFPDHHSFPKWNQVSLRLQTLV